MPGSAPNGSSPAVIQAVHTPSARVSNATVAPRPVSDEVPRTFDRRALELHAAADISEVFGPKFADQDRWHRRTRMPMDPLLLCSRVLEIEGTPLELGPARIVTEYDLPTDANWSHHDGKPNACVIVESGQADLFLVSWLGIEKHARGERVYRLLDCDLIFHGVRPEVGETLRHDIRIERFAELGETILFYFEYDCISTTDGRPVLSMRNGVRASSPPAELADPAGSRPYAAASWSGPTPRCAPCSRRRSTPGRSRCRRIWSTGASAAPSDPPSPSCDGSRLTLPDSEWRLAHAVEEVRLDGGPHGLGSCRIAPGPARRRLVQSRCHFKDDPCMPGTLMLEGCLQAVQTWMLGTGIAGAHPDGLFEPLPGSSFRAPLPRPGVPGHSELVYEAQIGEASWTGLRTRSRTSCCSGRRNPGRARAERRGDDRCAWDRPC